MLLYLRFNLSLAYDQQIGTHALTSNMRLFSFKWLLQFQGSLIQFPRACTSLRCLCSLYFRG